MIGAEWSPGEETPTFHAPWEAQAFAMTLSLHERGLFTWPEWAEALSAHIARADANGEPDDGSAYYHRWLEALEDMVATTSLASKSELAATRDAWEHAAARTPHGQPIELTVSDYPTDQ